MPLKCKNDPAPRTIEPVDTTQDAEELHRESLTLNSIVSVEKDKESGKLFYVVQWDGDGSYYREPADFMRKQHPEAVIQYLHGIIKWGKFLSQ